MEILDSSVVLWAAAVLGAGCIAAVWIRTCDRRPLMAFGWLLFLTLTTHDRLRSGYFLGDNGQGHGSVSVADLFANGRSCWVDFTYRALLGSACRTLS